VILERDDRIEEVEEVLLDLSRIRRRLDAHYRDQDGGFALESSS